MREGGEKIMFGLLVFEFFAGDHRWCFKCVNVLEGVRREFRWEISVTSRMDA